MKKLLKAIAGGALLFGLLGQPATVAANSEAVTRLADNVYAVFLQYYHSLVVVGDDGVLITDPAYSSRAEALKSEVAKLTDKPVTHVVLSHEHFDHIGGTEVFPRAQIIAQENIEAVLRFDPLGVAPDKIDITFASDYGIDMGTTRVQLKYIGAGDGVATTIVYLPREGIVATADLYEDQSLTLGAFLDDKNMLGARAILNEVSNWPLKHAVNSHSNSTDPEVLRANARYYNALFDAVMPTIEETAKSNPADIWELPDSLSKSVELPDYKDWGNYDQLPVHVKRMVLAIIHGG